MNTNGIVQDTEIVKNFGSTDNVKIGGRFPD